MRGPAGRRRRQLQLVAAAHRDCQEDASLLLGRRRMCCASFSAAVTRAGGGKRASAAACRYRPSAYALQSCCDGATLQLPNVHAYFAKLDFTMLRRALQDLRHCTPVIASRFTHRTNCVCRRREYAGHSRMDPPKKERSALPHRRGGGTSKPNGTPPARLATVRTIVIQTSSFQPAVHANRATGGFLSLATTHSTVDWEWAIWLKVGSRSEPIDAPARPSACTDRPVASNSSARVPVLRAATK